MSGVQLEIPPRSAYVGVVRLAVSALARAAGLDEDRVDDLKIAVSEACANVVLSQDDGSEAPVRIHWIEHETSVTVEVHDPAATELDPVSGQTDGASRSHMSYALLNSLVDQCEFEHGPQGGTTTRLVMMRTR